MAESQNKPMTSEEAWSGGKSPFKASYGKMMMWFFLLSDALTFGGLLIAYGFNRHAEPETWTVGEKAFNGFPFVEGELPLAYVALMTFILIISSVTMVLAVEAGHRNDMKGVIKWMALTVVGGFFFLGSQAWEWSHFIHGSGGAYQVGVPENSELLVSGKMKDIKAVNGEDSIATVSIEDGQRIYFSREFYASMNDLINNHSGAHSSHDDHGAHDDHKAEGDHGDHAEHDDHGEHGEHDDHAEHAEHDDHGHGEHAHAHFHDDRGFERCEELGISIDDVINHSAEGQEMTLLVNKYTPNTVIVSGEDVKKLWDAKEANTYVFGANLSQNEYGTKAYAQFFFFITGFHGFHVFSGVIINLIIFLMVLKGVFEERKHYEMVEKVGLYWHFVDLVWVFVFTFFYLV